jgi:hypothetical protein
MCDASRPSYTAVHRLSRLDRHSGSPGVQRVDTTVEPLDGNGYLSLIE